MTTLTPSASLIGNIHAFVITAGAEGVADAIKYGMMGQNIPLVARIVRDSFIEFENRTGTQIEPAWYAEVMQAVDTYFDRGPPKLRPYYYETVLCPTLRKHSVAIDRTTHAMESLPTGVPLHEHARTPDLREVLAFLRLHRALRFEQGLRTAIFGQQAVDAGFRVFRDALAVAMKGTNPVAGTQELLDIISVYGAIAHLGVAASAIPMYCDVLMHNLSVTDSAIIPFGGGTSPDDQVFYASIEMLRLSPRTTSILLRNGIRYLGELCRMSEQELLRLNQFGRESLREVKDFLSGCDFNLSLGMQVGELNPDYTLITGPLAPADYDGTERGEIFQIRLDGLKLSPRTVTILQSAGIVCVGDLCRKTASQLLNMPINHYGRRKVLKDSKRILATMGLSLGMQI